MKVTLKAARMNKRLTQKEAANLIGVSVDTLHNYENQKSFPDVPVIRKIEEVYGLTYADIIFLPNDYGLTVKTVT